MALTSVCCLNELAILIFARRGRSQRPYMRPAIFQLFHRVLAVRSFAHSLYILPVHQRREKNVFEYVCAPRILFTRSLLDRSIFFNHSQFDCARYVHGPSHLIRSELTNVLLEKIINFFFQFTFASGVCMVCVQFSSAHLTHIQFSNREKKQNWRSMLLVTDCLPLDLQLLGWNPSFQCL